MFLLCSQHHLKALATAACAQEAGARPSDSRKRAELLCSNSAVSPARAEVCRHLIAEVTAGPAHRIERVEPGYRPGNACWLTLSDHPQMPDTLRGRIKCLHERPGTIGTASGEFMTQAAATSETAHFRAAPGEEAAIPALFPATLLPLKTDMQRRLPMVGIRRLGDFAALSRTAGFEQWERHSC